MLIESTEVCSIDDELQLSRAVISRKSGSDPRPLLIGASVVSMGSSLLVMGGSSVCFSFGTYWNTGCYTLLGVGDASKCGVQSLRESPNGPWGLLHTVAAAKPTVLPIEAPPLTPVHSPISVSRVNIRISADFDQILRSAKPVILEGLNFGQCSERWTSSYLKECIGAEREVRFTSSFAGT